MSALSLLPSVAAALPGEHRTVVACLLRRPPRLSQPPVAVAEQRAGEPEQPKTQKRDYEELVPEDVAAVRLSVQAPGRHARVDRGSVTREGLQKMEDVKVHGAARSFLALLERDSEPMPKPVPVEDVPVEQLAEPRCVGDLAARRIPGLGQCRVARREDCDDLLYRHGLLSADLDGELVPDRALFLNERSRYRVFGAVPLDVRPCRLRDEDAGALRQGPEDDRALAQGSCLDRREMVSGQRPIPPDSGVDDVSVEDRANMEAT